MNIIKSILSKWFVVVACMIVAVAIGYFTQQNRFESEASLIFKVGREYMYQPEFGDRKLIAASRTDLQSAINAESHIMGSAEVLANALQKVGVDNFLGDDVDADDLAAVGKQQIAVDLLAEALSIRSISGTSVVRLSLEHENAEIARDTLDAVVNAFLERRREIYRDSSLELMQRKLGESEQAVQAAEADIRSFGEARNIYSFAEQIASLTQQQIRTAESLQNLAAEKNETELRLQLTQARSAEVPQLVALYTDTTSNSVYEDAKSQLFKLQLERNRTRGKYREDSTVVVRLEDEIAELQRFIAQQEAFTTSSVRNGRNPVYDELISQQIALESRLGSIIGRLESQKNLATELAQQRADMESIRAEYESKQANVKFLRERKLTYAEEVEKAQLSNEVNSSVRSSARLLQKPTLPITQMGIIGMERIRLSALLGFLAGVAWLLGLSLLRAMSASPVAASPNDAGTAAESATVTQPPRLTHPNEPVAAPEQTQQRRKKKSTEIHGIPVLGKISVS